MAGSINTIHGYIEISPDNGLTWFETCFAKSDGIDSTTNLIDTTGLCDTSLTYDYGFDDNSVSFEGMVDPSSDVYIFLRNAKKFKRKIRLRQGHERGEGSLQQKGTFIMSDFNFSREVDGVVQLSISGKLQDIVDEYL